MYWRTSYESQILASLKNGGYTPSLCQDCKNSVGLCSWSAHLIPVTGWTAEKTTLSGYKKRYNSYQVTDCPKFELDETKRKDKKYET